MGSRWDARKHWRRHQPAAGFNKGFITVLLRFRESRRIYSAVRAVREKMKPEKSRFEGKADARVQIFGGGDWETPKGLIDAAACDG